MKKLIIIIILFLPVFAVSQDAGQADCAQQKTLFQKLKSLYNSLLCEKSKITSDPKIKKTNDRWSHCYICANLREYLTIPWYIPEWVYNKGLEDRFSENKDELRERLYKDFVENRHFMMQLTVKEKSEFMQSIKELENH